MGVTLQDIKKLRHHISQTQYAREEDVVNRTIEAFKKIPCTHSKVSARAKELLEQYHASRQENLYQEMFHRISLKSEEGAALLSLSEALLRIPDSATANQLIQDKIQDIHPETLINTDDPRWQKTGAKLAEAISHSMGVYKIWGKVAGPALKKIMQKMIYQMAGQFIIGQSIEEAVSRAVSREAEGFLFSYDMLGEGARTNKQANEFFQNYAQTIESLKHSEGVEDSLWQRPAVSVKLSALSPYFHLRHREKLEQTLLPNLLSLAEMAKEARICLTIDAEEIARLDVTLWLFEQLMASPKLQGFDGIGLAVQAYHKTTLEIIDYIGALAEHYNRIVPVRLVKGAYWDYEIKQAQLEGEVEYPVFTQKAYTDLHYLACAQRMLSYGNAIFPQFATHNIHHIAMIENLAGKADYEFQLLQGMGEELYRPIAQQHPCRIYAPVGPYKTLLPYLIRRILENTANNSFIKKLADKEIALVEVMTDPLVNVEEALEKKEQHITLPSSIYQPSRENSPGLALGNAHNLAQLTQNIAAHHSHYYKAAAIVNGKPCKQHSMAISNPADPSEMVGEIAVVDEKDIAQALQAAQDAYPSWRDQPVTHRVGVLKKMALLLQEHQGEALSLLQREAGKTLEDALSEWRETIDFCHYYGAQAHNLIAQNLPSPTGEKNQLSLHGRGVFMCISPWNFPMAIFSGQVFAALVAGNTVLAKPASQTPLIAHFIVKLLYQAGVPSSVLHFVPGQAKMIGDIVFKSKWLAGVAFTGSTETASHIQRNLHDPLIPFIAETGGQNAMIVDSSALLEQVVDDVVISSFNSVGQRCSALRILCVQEDIAEPLTQMLCDSLEHLVIDHPQQLYTDIGPAISQETQAELLEYCQGKSILAKGIAPQEKGYFIAPHIIEIKQISELKKEIFGPVLHLYRYKAKELPALIDAINATGFGLTLGVHSRISQRIRYITQHAAVGNIYVNRSMIGAVPGTQPFGGQGLSGTGPKAGGPHYLLKFCHEKCVSVNETAIGGNRQLIERFCN